MFECEEFRRKAASGALQWKVVVTILHCCFPFLNRDCVSHFIIPALCINARAEPHSSWLVMIAALPDPLRIASVRKMILVVAQRSSKMCHLFGGQHRSIHMAELVLGQKSDNREIDPSQSQSVKHSVSSAFNRCFLANSYSCYFMWTERGWFSGRCWIWGLSTHFVVLVREDGLLQECALGQKRDDREMYPSQNQPVNHTMSSAYNLCMLAGSHSCMAQLHLIEVCSVEMSWKWN